MRVAPHVQNNAAKSGKLAFLFQIFPACTVLAFIFQLPKHQSTALIKLLLSDNHFLSRPDAGTASRTRKGLAHGAKL